MTYDTTFSNDPYGDLSDEEKLKKDIEAWEEMDNHETPLEDSFHVAQDLIRETFTKVKVARKLLARAKELL